MANFAWLISNNYQSDPPFELITKYSDPRMNLYLSGILGVFDKQFESNAYLEYFRTINIDKKQDIRKIFELIMIRNSEDILVSLRPGTIDLKKYFYGKIYDHYAHFPPKDISEELEYAYFLKKSGIIPKTTPTIRAMIQDILTHPSHNTNELLNFIESILQRYFHIEVSTFNAQKIQQIKERAKNRTVKKTTSHIQWIKYPQRSIEKEEIYSAEFTDNHFQDPIENKDYERSFSNIYGNNQEQRIYHSIQQIFGQPIFSSSKIENLEKSICTGVHRGEKIYFTRGIYDTSIEAQYRHQLKLETIRENKNHYEKNRLIYQRSITKLKNILQYEVLKDIEEQNYQNSFGEIMPDQIWRLKKLNDINIFRKTEKNDPGKIIVDILLDQSASQKEQQESVCAQAFCISEALAELQIPTRVLGFCNLYHYSILRIYREYREDRTKNRSIFEYQASGSNRDGLAYKLIGEMLKKPTSEHKVLIILSDGRPNDIVNLKLIGRKNNQIPDYTGEMAIEDSAKEIFQIRNREISVLGVFTGKKEDLEAEKNIFGQNFCYISKIERFSEVVGHFLKAILKN